MNSDFKELLGALSRARVRYLMVGGYAVIYHTEPRFTKDLDLWIEPTRENAERLRRALIEFGAWLDHMSIDDFSSEQVMFQLGIPPVRIDLLTSVPGLEFAACWERREDALIDALQIPVVGLEDLITAKERAGRDQDLLDLGKLRKSRGD